MLKSIVLLNGKSGEGDRISLSHYHHHIMAADTLHFSLPGGLLMGRWSLLLPLSHMAMPAHMHAAACEKKAKENGGKADTQRRRRGRKEGRRGSPSLSTTSPFLEQQHAHVHGIMTFMHAFLVDWFRTGTSLLLNKPSSLSVSCLLRTFSGALGMHCWHY